MRFRACFAGFSVAALLVGGCGPSAPTINFAPTPTSEAAGAPVQAIATIARTGDKTTTVKVASPTRGAIASTLTYNGHVQADQQVQVAPKAIGRIEKYNVEIGGEVKTGDVIATIGITDRANDILKAQAAYDAAAAHLSSMQAGPRADNLVEAKANVANAKSKLAAIKNGPRPETVAQARAALVSAQAKLHAVTATPRPEIVAQAQNTLKQAKTKLALFLAGPSAAQVKAADIAIAQAKNSLLAAQAARDGLCAPPNPKYQCDGAQATVDAGTSAVEAAEQQKIILIAPPTAAAAQQARDDEAAAEQQYKIAIHPYTADDITQAKAAVDAAQQMYNLARMPTTQADIDEAQAAVDVAEAALRLAATPFTDVDLKLADTAVATAKADLDVASSPNVLAPIDGIVAQKLLDVGALTGPGLPIVTLVSRGVKISANVDESKLSFVTIGQEARVTVPAYPDSLVMATVVTIPQMIDPQARTGEIRLQVTKSSIPLKPGMFAQISLLSAQRQNALLVPQTALDTVNGQTVVYAVVNNTIEVKPVTVGLSDEQSAEITTGLSDGQVVVVGDKPVLSEGQRVTAQPAPG